MNENYIELEKRVQQLEQQVQLLIEVIHNSHRTRKFNQTRAEALFNEIVLSSNEYERLNDFPYHDCLKYTLLKHLDPSLEWKAIELNQLKELLEIINLKYHDYYFETMAPILKTEREKEIEIVQFCKINEYKFRHEHRLRDIRKSIWASL